MGRRALRLTFAYDGDEVTLKSAEPLEKRIPPSDALIRGGEPLTAVVSGSRCATTRTGAVASTPPRPPQSIRRGPGRGPGGRFERVDVDRPAGSFRVLVPDLPTAKRVTVFASTRFGRGGRRSDEEPQGARPSAPSIWREASRGGYHRRHGGRDDQGRGPGPDADHLVVAVVSEGYESGDLGQFADDVDDFIATWFATPPFDQVVNQQAFNVYRVDVASTDSGADDPGTCAGGTGTLVDTYFDGSYCWDGVFAAWSRPMRTSWRQCSMHRSRDGTRPS